jgi:hypothetical protein
LNEFAPPRQLNRSMLSMNPTCRFLIFALVAVLATASGRAQTAGDKGLELTTEIVRQRYCTGDADLDGVWFDLRLLYRNTGTAPVILYKGTDVYEVVVRKTADGPIEVDSHISWYSDKPWAVGASSLRKLFVVLKPNDIYEAATKAGVFVTRDDDQHFQGSVQSGDHYLQVTIPTWHGSQELANAMQRKWRSNGTLWRHAVTSQPMKFTIAKNRTVSHCS